MMGKLNTTNTTKTTMKARLRRALAGFILLFGILAACTTEDAVPEPLGLTFDEPVDCSLGQAACTLMVDDGSLSLAGAAQGDVTKMSYSLNEGPATPVTLLNGEFEFDIADLPEGGNSITITIEDAEGNTLLSAVIVIHNPGANLFEPDELTVYVSNNGPDNRGNIDVFNERFELQSVFMGGNNQGLELDRFGNVYQAGDTERGASVRVISQLYSRENLAFDPEPDAEIVGDATGLIAPKGLDLAEEAGQLIVADFGGGNLKVFDAAADGNVAPLAQTDLPAPAWDVVYDAPTDRLFAALTDGTVAVFDAYLEAYGGDGPDRTITPARDGEKISDNLHGVVYDLPSDTLIVSDVGAATTVDQPGFQRDGSIYVLENASSADGNTEPRRVVEGRWTLLGNPVDIILNGSELRVAEKAGDFLLVFDNIFDPNSATLPDEVMPDLVKTEIKPEALIDAPMDFDMPEEDNDDTPVQTPDVTDIDTETDISAVYAVSNTPESGNDFLVILEPDLSSSAGAFDTTPAAANPENITFDLKGNGYVTFDNGSSPSQGSILVLSKLAEGRDSAMFNASTDRVIQGHDTGLVAPKGIELVSDKGVAIVTDFGAKDIKVFSAYAGGNAPPLYVTDDLGGDRSVWDADYDLEHDRLFVAATDGTVLVYDAYLSDYGEGGPDRVITPTLDGNKASVNLHGVVHVASSDMLILSDVGDAGSNADGQLFTLENAGAADGSVAVSAQVGGPNSTLGNPVDITFDGADLYVAEKTKDTVLRFNDILSLTGSQDASPDASVRVDNAESVALLPDYLLDE